MFDGWSTQGPVKLIFTVVRRRDLRQVTALIRKINPSLFFSVEDIRMTHAGVFPKDTTEKR